MGDPGQCHFDGTRWMNLRWRDILGALRPVRSPRRVPEESRFRLGKEGAGQNDPSNTDTGVVNLGSGAAPRRTIQEHRAKAFMGYKQHCTCWQSPFGLGAKRAVFVGTGPAGLVCLQASRTGGCDYRAVDGPSGRMSRRIRGVDGVIPAGLCRGEQGLPFVQREVFMDMVWVWMTGGSDPAALGVRTRWLYISWG